MPMTASNLTEDPIPQIIDVGKRGVSEHVAVPGAAAPGAAVGVAAARAAAEVPGKSAAGWSDTRPISEQMAAYPATCVLATTFLAVFLVMRKRNVSPSTMGSSYRHLVHRSEWWRVLTAALTHNGVLHLGFNVSSLWGCRRMEAELGSWVYLLASAHLLVVAEMVEKTILHLLLRTGRFVDGISVGYSGVIFAWMAVLSLKPDAPPVRTIGGIVFDSFAYVLLTLVVVKIVIRRSSFLGHLAGIFAGIVFSTGGLDFARERYWGVGLAVWALAVLFGSLKSTTRVPVPLLDFVDVSRRRDLGVGVVPLDWSNREGFEDYVVDNA